MIVDIASIPIGVKLTGLRQVMRSLIRTANQGHRNLPQVTVRPEQFASMLRAATKGRDENAPRVIGLTLDGVPIVAKQVLA